MQFKELLTDERAVSPVIGVILMVAITVILAAVIGTFVLGLGSSVQQTTPQATFGFEVSNSSQNVTVTHETGDSIPASQLNLSATQSFSHTDVANDPSTTNDKWTNLGASGTISAGDSIEVTSPSGLSGATFRVTWFSEQRENSATLATFEVPS